MSALEQLLVGRWRNTAGEQTRGILDVEITRSPTGIRMDSRIVGRDGIVAWPSVDCELFTTREEDQQPGVAALGKLELDELAVELQLRVNKGILCVMSWTCFPASTRHAWVTRELFARELEP